MTYDAAARLRARARGRRDRRRRAGVAERASPGGAARRDRVLGHRDEHRAEPADEHRDGRADPEPQRRRARGERLREQGRGHGPALLGRLHRPVRRREAVGRASTRSHPTSRPASTRTRSRTRAASSGRVLAHRAGPDEPGTVTTIVSGGVDITERRTRELELERERDVQTTVFETMPSIMVVLERDGSFATATSTIRGSARTAPSGRRLAGVTTRSSGAPFLDLVVEDDDGRAARAIATAAAGRASERSSRSSVRRRKLARFHVVGRPGGRRHRPNRRSRARLGHRRHRAQATRRGQGARAHVPQRDREQRPEPALPHRR